MNPIPIPHATVKELQAAERPSATPRLPVTPLRPLFAAALRRLARRLGRRLGR